MKLHGPKISSYKYSILTAFVAQLFFILGGILALLQYTHVAIFLISIALLAISTSFVLFALANRIVVNQLMTSGRGVLTRLDNQAKHLNTVHDSLLKSIGMTNRTVGRRGEETVRELSSSAKKIEKISEATTRAQDAIDALDAKLNNQNVTAEVANLIRGLGLVNRNIMKFDGSVKDLAKSQLDAFECRIEELQFQQLLITQQVLGTIQKPEIVAVPRDESKGIDDDK